MRSATVLKDIQQTVQYHLPGSRVILFGSRARGNYDDHSDYDLLIITPVSLTPGEKIVINTRLDKAIVDNIKIPVDILINSEEEVLQKKELPGHIIRSALKEGILL